MPIVGGNNFNITTTITTTVKTREEMYMETLKRIPYKTIEKYLRNKKLEKLKNV
jgi:hypothetical protein